MKSMQTWVVSAVATAALLGLAGCAGMSQQDRAPPSVQAPARSGERSSPAAARSEPWAARRGGVHRPRSQQGRQEVRKARGRSRAIAAPPSSTRASPARPCRVAPCSLPSSSASGCSGSMCCATAFVMTTMGMLSSIPQMPHSHPQNSSEMNTAAALIAGDFVRHPCGDTTPTSVAIANEAPPASSAIAAVSNERTPPRRSLRRPPRDRDRE